MSVTKSVFLTVFSRHRDYLPELRRLQKERVCLNLEPASVIPGSHCCPNQDSKLEALKQDSMTRLMADMKVEEAERRARGLPTDRERFPNSDDEDEDMPAANDSDSDGVDGGSNTGPSIDMRRARRVHDPAMEADGSKWPRPG